MPSTNAVKKYLKGGIYHVYNRGNNKDLIFFYEEDYLLFKYLLFRYLTKPTNGKKIQNYSGAIKLHAFCLMPNHFHMILEQLGNKTMSGFMKSLLVSYSLIVNGKHKRVGHVFQGVYKARLLATDADLMTVSNYIHLNPVELGKDPTGYLYSSYRYYLDTNKDCEFLTKDKLCKYVPGLTSIGARPRSGLRP